MSQVVTDRQPTSDMVSTFTHREAFAMLLPGGLSINLFKSAGSMSSPRTDAAKTFPYSSII